MPKTQRIDKTDILLLIILVVAATLRYWGIDFGLPNTQCRPDEEFLTNIVFSPAASFHPGSFNYPSLYKYILLVLYAFYFLVGLMSGKYASMIDLFTDYHMNPSNFYLINRALAAFLGTLTVFVVYKIARQLYDKKTGILASFFICVAYLHVRDSHFGCVDVPQTFFVMSAMLFIVKSYKYKTLKNYIAAGMLAGLATSTKYAGILLIVPMGAVHLYNTLSLNHKKYYLFIDKRILLFMGAFAGSFLLGTPFSLIDFPNFISDFLFEMRHLSRGHYLILGIGWWYHIKFSLFYGLGWPLFFAALIGILIFFKVNLRKAIILYSFPLIYYILSGKGYTVFLRYMIPVIPFLCIGASTFLMFITDKLLIRINPHKKNIFILLIALLISYLSIYNIIQFNRLISKKDNRLIAMEWVNKNIPRGSSVYQTAFLWGRLQLRPVTGLCKGKYKQISVPANRDNRRTFRVKINCLENTKIPEYELWEYNGNKEMFEYENEFNYSLPDCIIVAESPLVIWSSMLPETKLEKLLKNAYRLKKSFKAVDCENKENLYDQQDAFYVPFTGFEKVVRPGPNIYIYERKH